MKSILSILMLAVFAAGIIRAQTSAPTLQSKPTPTPAKTQGGTATKGVPQRNAKGTRPADAPEMKPKWQSQEPPTPVPTTIAGTDSDGKAKQLFEQAREFFTQHKPETALPLLRDAEKLAPARYEIQVLLGASLGILRRHPEALTAFQKAASLNPKSPQARGGICWILSETGRRIEAIDECKEAVRLDPNDVRIRSILASMYLTDDQQANAAVELLEAAYAKGQNDPIFLGMLGDAYFVRGDYARAAELYEKIVQNWPAVSVAFLRLSGVYDYLGRFDDSIKAARKFVELEPRLPFAYLNLGRKLGDMGFFDEAVEPLQKAASLEPANGEAYLALSNIYEILGDKENMLQSLRHAYQLMPHTVELSYKLGTSLWDYGYTEEAIAPLEEANSNDPDRAPIMRALGLVYIQANRNLDEGVALVERAAQISPLPPNMRIDVSSVKKRHDLLGRFDEIVDFVRKNPDDIQAHEQLVKLYEFKGMTSEAEHEYLEVIRLMPNDYRSYNEIAIFYNDHGQFEKAVEAGRKAIQLYPHHVLYLVLSNNLAKLGRLDEALEAAKRSVEIKATLLESRIWLGDLYLKKGFRNDALREYLAAFDLATVDPRPNFKLAWLYIRMGNKEGALRHYGILRGVAPTELRNLELCLHAHFGDIP